MKVSEYVKQVVTTRGDEISKFSHESLSKTIKKIESLLPLGFDTVAESKLRKIRGILLNTGNWNLPERELLDLCFPYDTGVMGNIIFKSKYGHVQPQIAPSAEPIPEYPIQQIQKKNREDKNTIKVTDTLLYELLESRIKKPEFVQALITISRMEPKPFVSRFLDKHQRIYYDGLSSSLISMDALSEIKLEHVHNDQEEYYDKKLSPGFKSFLNCINFYAGIASPQPLDFQGPKYLFDIVKEINSTIWSRNGSINFWGSDFETVIDYLSQISKTAAFTFLGYLDDKNLNEILGMAKSIPWQLCYCFGNPTSSLPANLLVICHHDYMLPDCKNYYLYPCTHQERLEYFQLTMPNETRENIAKLTRSTVNKSVYTQNKSWEDLFDLDSIITQHLSNSNVELPISSLIKLKKTTNGISIDEKEYPVSVEQLGYYIYVQKNSRLLKYISQERIDYKAQYRPELSREILLREMQEAEATNSTILLELNLNHDLRKIVMSWVRLFANSDRLNFVLIE